jgi:MFS family permease
LRSLLPDTGPLREREFRLLYLGQGVSSFGSALTYVALPLQMYQLTCSTVLVGLLGLVEFLPMFLLAFVGGALADRFDRRRLAISAESVLAAGCLVLAANALLPTPRVWVLWFIAALLAGLNALHRPALEALTQQVVPFDRLPAVGPLQSIRHNFAHIAGPAIAGFVAATFGAHMAFALDCATSGFSISMLALMRPVPLAAAHEEAITWRTLLEGWRYARARQDLLGTYLIDMNAMFFGMPNALFPAIGEQWGPGAAGLLYAAPGVGALLASLTAGWTARVHRHGLAIIYAASAWGLAIVGFGLSRSLAPALVWLALAGGADNISGIFRYTLWNQTIPHRLRGRTAAIEMVSYLSGPYLGNVEAGFAARAFGLGPSVALGGLLCVAGSVALAAALPRFRRYDARSSAPA